jgi:dCTP deaminase
MILSDTKIRHALLNERLIITPFVDKYVQPNSYDIHLHPDILLLKQDIPENKIVYPDQDSSDLWEQHNLDEEVICVFPGEIALGRSVEYFEFLDVAGRLEGVSSLGRIFLRVHVTAGFFDYGFKGTATIEIKSDFMYPIRLYPRMRIGQMAFEEVSGKVTKKYAGRYQNQVKPTASRRVSD